MKSLIAKFKVKEDSGFPKGSSFNELIKEISSDRRVKIFNDGRSRLGKQLVAFAIGTGPKN
jgi:hypothetical protein